MVEQRDARRQLYERAYRQAGFFTAAQARDAGYSPQSQKYHADRGNWQRVERGLYRLAEWPSDEPDSYTRWSVWSHGSGIISHDSAAAVHGIGDLDPQAVHLTLPSVTRARRPGVIFHVGELPAGDVEQRETFRVTTPTRTILDLADSPITQEQFTELLADALDRALMTRSELTRRADDFGSRAALRIERSLNVEQQA